MTGAWFDAFFTQVYGRPPFPWQARMAREVLAGHWPASVALPTAAGKTALIDIAVFALAAGVPCAARRIFFVVDRRVVVDEAADRAEHLAKCLQEAPPETPAGRVAKALQALAGPDSADAPLYVGTLRGGMPRDDAWTRSPFQPTVCCSTVDQVGSSLLFRAYGSRSNRNWPIRAGLAANDALIIVDEAHTAQPFLQTLGQIAEYRRWGGSAIETPFRVMEMSATPRPGVEAFRESHEDREGLLGTRWRAAKRTRLVVAPLADPADEGSFEGLAKEMAGQARAMRQAGAKVIGVVANRVATARRIHTLLSADEGCQAELLTGRARPFDREQVWERLLPSARLEREQDPEQPVYVVATQCIEVGANLDFDALVTEIAGIDALEQRFGRLNRNGRPIEARAAIVAQKNQTEKKYDDAVYGEALTATWRWLVGQAQTEGKGKGKGKVIDLGVDSLRALLARTDVPPGLRMARRNAPVLLPAHVDRWSETAPQPAVEAEPALFLHGPKSGPADVLVVWRADLNAANQNEWPALVNRVPPSPEEMLAVPVWAVRRWLAREPDPALVADIEGVAANGRVKGALRPVLDWQGDEATVRHDVLPGRTIVAPAAYGGCDRWGWNPASEGPVTDIADIILSRTAPVLRLDVEQWGAPSFTAVHALRSAETDAEIDSALAALVVSAGEAWYGVAAAGLLAAGRKRRRQFRGRANEDGIAELTALSALGPLAQESRTASFTNEVALGDHLAACETQARAYAAAAGLPPRLAATVAMAALLHDIGKADPRFQAWLRGRVVLPLEADLAKSGGNGRDWTARDRARREAGYPTSGRHELQSVALLQNAEFDATIDRDLLLHLVGSHHGWCRPFAPVAPDELPVEVRFGEWSASSAHRLEYLASGVAERFWRLTRRYGWWGLAYLETLVRLTDQRVSEREQKEKASHAATSN